MASSSPHCYIPFKSRCPLCGETSVACYLISDDEVMQSSALRFARMRLGDKPAYVRPPTIDEFESALGIKFVLASVCSHAMPHRIEKHEAMCPECFPILRELQRQRRYDCDGGAPILEKRSVYFSPPRFHSVTYNIANQMPWLKCFAAELHPLEYNDTNVGMAHSKMAHELSRDYRKMDSYGIMGCSWMIRSSKPYLPISRDPYYTAEWSVFESLPAFSHMVRMEYSIASADGVSENRVFEISSFDGMRDAVIASFKPLRSCDVCSETIMFV